MITIANNNKTEDTINISTNEVEPINTSNSQENIENNDIEREKDVTLRRCYSTKPTDISREKFHSKFYRETY